MTDLKHHRDFGRVARYYRQRHAALDLSGTGAYRFTSLGAWATSRSAHVYYFFRKIKLARFDLMIDLGSGDGLVACIAGLFTRAIGIEADPALCLIAQLAASDLELASRVSFICGDYRTQRIWKADCMYLYPDKPFFDLEALLNQWRGTLLVYGPHLDPRHFLPTQRLRCAKERLTLYCNAPNVDHSEASFHKLSQKIRKLPIENP